MVRSGQVSCATPPRQVRQGDGKDEGAAVEELLHEALYPEQLQSGDAGHQEVDRDERAPGIEPAGRDARGSQECVWGAQSRSCRDAVLVDESAEAVATLDAL